MKQSLAATLTSLLAETELTINAEQQQQLLALVGLLDKWNKAYNLTSVRDPQQMLSRHIVDSLVVLPSLTAQRYIDVGTGPGLPGLPLAIAAPDKQFVLLDSLGKRIRFIRQVCHELGIDNVSAVHARVEDYTDPEGFDGVLSRAFASLNDMLSWCSHLTNADGRFFALKGQYPEQEIAQLNADPQSRWLVEQVKPLVVPGVIGERHIVIIKAAA